MACETPPKPEPCLASGGPPGAPALPDDRRGSVPAMSAAYGLLLTSSRGIRLLHDQERISFRSEPVRDDHTRRVRCIVECSVKRAGEPGAGERVLAGLKGMTRYDGVAYATTHLGTDNRGVAEQELAEK